MHIGVWQNAYMHYLILKCIWAFSKRWYAPLFPINSTSLLPQSCSFSRFLLFFFSSSLIQCCCCFVFFVSFVDVFYFVFFGGIWFYNVDMILLLFFYILLVVLILYIWVSCFMNYSCYCLCLYILFYMCLYILFYVYVTLGLTYYSLCLWTFFFLVLNNQEEKCFLFFLENTYRRFAKRRYEILLFNTAHRRFIKRLCA